MDCRIKILWEDMTEHERELIKDKVDKLKIKGYSKHAEQRMRDKGINTEEILRALRNGDVIELNYEYGTSPRLLIRGRDKDLHKYCTCIVIALDGRICTCYKNEEGDSHKTLRADRYKEYYIKNLISLIIN